MDKIMNENSTDNNRRDMEALAYGLLDCRPEADKKNKSEKDCLKKAPAPGKR